LDYAVKIQKSHHEKMPLSPVDSTRLSKHGPDDVQGAENGNRQADKVWHDHDEDVQRPVNNLHVVILS
jgi:hypothetical protein